MPQPVAPDADRARQPQRQTREPPPERQARPSAPEREPTAKPSDTPPDYDTWHTGP